MGIHGLGDGGWVMSHWEELEVAWPLEVKDREDVAFLTWVSKLVQQRCSI